MQTHDIPTGQVVPFRPRPVPRADPQTVALALMALEAAPLFAPLILAARDLGGVHYVGMAVAGRTFRLTPDEARLLGECLWRDPFEPGFDAICVQLNDAAIAAERGLTRGAA